MPLGRRDFLRTLGATTAGAALSRTAPSIVAASTGENGIASARSPHRSLAEAPPLFQKSRPDWEIKFADVNSRVLSVMPGESHKTFYDPLIKRTVQWEQDAYSLSCAVYNAGLSCVYRGWGEDGQWRLARAWSSDGLQFKRSDKPFLYARPEDKFLGSLTDPNNGGASVTYGDSRLYEDENGTFYLFFNFFRFAPPKQPHQELAVATSRDMEHWTVHGRAFAKQAERDVDVIPGVKAPRFWPGLITRLKRDRLIAARIHGKYWMYLSNVSPQFSDGYVATSEDLLNWEIHWDAQGRPAKMLALRPGYFDSNWIDPVAAVLRQDGILLIYNGINADAKHGGDPRRMPFAHYPAQALFDKDDPIHLLERSESPFKGGDKELEKQPMVFWMAPLYEAWSLVAYRNELLLYWNNAFGRRSVGLWKAPIPKNISSVEP